MSAKIYPPNSFSELCLWRWSESIGCKATPERVLMWLEDDTFREFCNLLMRGKTVAVAANDGVIALASSENPIQKYQ